MSPSGSFEAGSIAASSWHRPLIEPGGCLLADVGAAAHAGGMDLLRTPDDRFDDLPDWTYPPSYVTVDGIRIAFYDAGPPHSSVVLLLHGEPTWSYLYRSVIPPLIAAGLRVIAIDLVGFGQSDKPASRDDYTYQRHVEWLESVVVDHLDLSDITLFCHDWGGLLGLRLVAGHTQRFARVIAANTYLPTGEKPPGGDFLGWREYSQTVPVLQVGSIVNSACRADLAPEIIAAYDAPFPDERFKAGARQFPVLVPIAPDDPASQPNTEAREQLRHYDKPFLTVFSDSDPVTKGQDTHLQQLIPGSAGQPHRTVRGGHFLQEDAGPEIAGLLIDFIRAT